jgi:hypothetical protein
VYYDAKNNDWKIFGAIGNITEARLGLTSC